MNPKDFKRFVTASTSKSDSFEKIRSKKLNLMMSGDEVRKMYEEILETPMSDRKPVTPATKMWISRKPKITKDFTKLDLFKCIHDCEKTREILLAHPEFVNETDSFNWSPLMMASCEGQSEVCEELLEFGAHLDFSDGKGNTARSLAVKKNHLNVIQVLDSFGVDICSSDSDEVEEFYCDVCKEKIKESDKREHEASTLHQFNCKSQMESEIPTFGIPKSNRGFQLMLKQGWSSRTGLGPQQKGRKYPVKTVLRRDRQGLGVKQKPARVSHFAPHDKAAIKFKEPPKTKTRKDMQWEKIKNRQLEHKLRRELS